MLDDLKLIKNMYGEKMMHLCREKFSTLLEETGLLYNIMISLFSPSKLLYDDLMENNLVYKFISYIYSKANSKVSMLSDIEVFPPNVLLAKAGYNLYKCKTEADISKFKKYYKKEEELCTFRGDRLNSCYVYFAVKKDVEQIKREDFEHPKREDLYGTSVISIQIDRINHYLSIKNRYNHTVDNPDATFSNNLDNIFPGLTKSFEKELNLKINENSIVEFEIPGYVRALDGKLYKYNLEAGNIYYCPNNIIIKEFKVQQFDKSEYLLIEDSLIDLKNKVILSIDEHTSNGFLNHIDKIDRICIIKKDQNKIISIDNEIIIEVDQYNRVLKYIDYKSVSIGDFFLYKNDTIEYLYLEKVQSIGNYCLSKNKTLKYAFLDNVKVIGDFFLDQNNCMINMEMQNVMEIGNNFMACNNTVINASFPNLMIIKNNFFKRNSVMKSIYLGKLMKCGDFFMFTNDSLRVLFLPSVVEIGCYFLYNLSTLKELYLPNLEQIGEYYLCNCSNSQVLEIIENRRQKIVKDLVSI